MPLFICEKCGCVDNTALGLYWIDWFDKKPILCAECHPKIGKWHGKFAKKKWNGEEVLNKPKEKEGDEK